MRDWCYGHISLGQFKARVLCGFYICLAADAEDDFRHILMSKFEEIRNEA